MAERASKWKSYKDFVRTVNTGYSRSPQFNRNYRFSRYVQIVSAQFLQVIITFQYIQSVNHKYLCTRYSVQFVVFAARCYAQTRFMPSCGVLLSVRPSVRLSRSCILSKLINISSKFFTISQPYHLQFSIGLPNVITIFRLIHPNGGVECKWGRQKSRLSSIIWLHRVL